MDPSANLVPHLKLLTSPTGGAVNDGLPCCLVSVGARQLFALLLKQEEGQRERQINVYML